MKNNAIIEKATPLELFRRYSVIVTAVIMVVIATAITKGTYLTGSNMLNVGERGAAIGLIALGQMLVILTGGLDLSVSGTLAIGYCITSLLLANTHLPVPAVMILMLVGTTLCGAINGFLVAKTKVPPFMLTLGTYMIYQSLAFVISKAANLIFTTQADWMVQNWHLGGLMGRLFPSMIWVAVSIAVILLLAYSRFGKNIYQTGGKELAAKMSGIKTDWIKFFVYTASGFLCGIAAIILEFRLGFCNASSTSTFQIVSIAAVIIGGTNLKGGEGNVYGTFIGAFIMASLDNLMNLVGLDVYTQSIVKGVVLLGFMSVMYLFSDNFRKGASEG